MMEFRDTKTSLRDIRRLKSFRKEGMVPGPGPGEE
jgi:hypothetical protein